MTALDTLCARVSRARTTAAAPPCLGRHREADINHDGVLQFDEFVFIAKAVTARRI